MKQSLTDMAIKKLRPKSNRYDVWDMRVQNLGIRVFPSGAKSFFLSYYHHKRKKRETIGRYPDIPLQNARQIALNKKSLLALGEDPSTPIDGLIFEDILGDFFKIHVERHNKPSTQRSTKQLLNNQCLPKWKTYPLSQIKRSDIISVLDDMVERGSAGASNNCYSAMSKFFNWCMARGLLATNPFDGIARPAPKRTRDRVLTDKEVKIIYDATRVLGYPYGDIVALLLFTAQRRGELVNMVWKDIAQNECIWTIPQDQTKNGRTHTLPLTETPLQIITGAPRIHDSYVFPARGNDKNVFSGFGKSKCRLDETITKLNDNKPINPWRIHDLRRTAATRMAQLEVPPHIIERVLNHSSGQLGGVAGIYNRYAYLDEMRDALTKWHDYVLALK
jgi:integrase